MCEHCREEKQKKKEIGKVLDERFKEYEGIKGAEKIYKELGDRPYEDLSGKKFGRLVAKKAVGREKLGMILWLCECTCEYHGKIILRVTNLKSGRPSSCDLCQNLKGQSIGYWTVLEDDNSGKVLARCKCGVVRKVIKKNIGRTSMSCGCIHGAPRTIYRHDLVGQRFSHLLVLKKVGMNNDNRALWLCKCDCGNECVYNTKQLIENVRISCGCIQKPKPDNAKNLLNMKFGHLTVIGRAENKDNRAHWLCRCDCNNEIVVSSKILLNGEKTHCGCIKRPTPPNFVDLTGKKFNSLTVLKRVDDLVQDNGRKRVRYLVRCDCGNEFEVNADSITTSNTKSCGCLNSSGEKKIEEILKENNIEYEKQKTYEDLKSDKNCSLRFDFYILNGSYLIEYDGEQHYVSRNAGWMTEEVLKDNQRRDNIKNIYCETHDIPLIRIPYTHFKELCLEDLLLKTTKFRVV